MKKGELILAGNTPAVYIESSVNGELVQCLGGVRTLVPANTLKQVEMTMELAQRFVPLLPDAIFTPAPYSTGLTGTDPEIFSFDTHGKVIPAWEFLPDNKSKASVYWDGVQAEFTVVPSHCHSWVTDSVHARLNMLYGAVTKYKPGAQLIPQDCVELDTRTLNLGEDEHINLGCSPSINAYPTINPIHIPDPRTHTTRYSGCHLHYSVSGLPTPDWFPHGVVVMMDKVLGVCLTALGRDMENPLRRVAYGRPGEYRVPGPQDNRLEYRTPGAFLLHHPALFNFAADLGRAAYRMGLQLDGRLSPLPDVKDAILRCDADEAFELIRVNRTFYEHLFTKMGYDAKKTMKLLEVGARASKLFVGTVAINWRLGTGYASYHNNIPNGSFATLVRNSSL